MVLEFADRAWHAQDEEGWEINAGQMWLACADAALAVLLRVLTRLPCPLLGDELMGHSGSDRFRQR